jgi:DNA topoisomerase VI subunit B
MKGGGTLILRIVPDAEQEMVDLTVRDTGCGIAASDLPRIFEPFFSTKSGPDESGHGGSGLGLAACRTIIESHRGRIRVESTVGRGTAFTLRLPMAKSKPAAQPSVSQPSVSQPSVSQSSVSQSAVSQSAVSQPAVSQSAVPAPTIAAAPHPNGC